MDAAPKNGSRIGHVFGGITRQNCLQLQNCSRHERDGRKLRAGNRQTHANRCGSKRRLQLRVNNKSSSLSSGLETDVFAIFSWMPNSLYSDLFVYQ